MKKKKNTTSNEITEEQLIKELEYLVAEGFVEKIGDTFRLKTKQELENEIREV